MRLARCSSEGGACARAWENRLWARKFGLYRGRTWRGRPGAWTAIRSDLSSTPNRRRKMRCGPQLPAAQGRKRRLLPAAGPWPRPKKKKEGKAGYSAGPGGKGAGLPGQIPGKEKREAFTFFLSSILNTISNRFEFLLNFWIKANHHNKKYAPA